MATPEWRIRGQYYETCSCDFLCPCVLWQMTARPTKGTCTFAMAFQIENGTYGAVSLEKLGFVVLGFTPEEMGKGNWSVGLIIDERATPEQRDAIAAIASGQAGGPMASLSGLIGKFLGVDSAPIRFDRQGAGWSVEAGKFAAMSAEPALGLNPHVSEPLYLDNSGHPAANRVALAHPRNSRVNALGLEWADSSGRNSGQYAPFSWQNA